MRVETIYLKKTGPFAELRLDFQPKLAEDKADVHILVGQNGTGKSTILTAVAALFQPYVGSAELAKRLYSSNSWVEGKVDTEFVGLGWKSAYQQNEASRLQEGIGLRSATVMVDKNVPCSWTGSHYHESYACTYQQVTNQLESGSASRNLNVVRLNFAAFAYSGYRNLDHIDLNAIEEIKTKPLAEALKFNRNTQLDYKNLVKWLALIKSKAALAAYRQDNQTAARREEALTRIEGVVSQIIDKPIKFEISDEPLAVNLRVDGRVSNFDVLPDGLKSILGWVSDLMMRMEQIPWENDLPVFERNFLLLLDEIEVHLHPAWQRKVLPALQKLFSNAQIILSTHSPFVVGSVSDAWIYPLKMQDDGNVALDEPVRSQTGMSYPTVVSDIFGIDETFGEAAERRLDQFEIKRDAFLQGKVDIDALRKFGEEISTDSVELRNIVSREIRQAEQMLASQRTGTMG